jgi:hypothetical protein
LHISANQGESQTSRLMEDNHIDPAPLAAGLSAEQDGPLLGSGRRFHSILVGQTIEAWRRGLQ